MGHRITGGRPGQSNSRGPGCDYVHIAIACLRASVACDQWLGVTLGRVLAVNASCRKSFACAATCTDCGLSQIRSKSCTPKTNGQAKRLIRASRDATVKRVHHDDHGRPRRHLDPFISACTPGRRPKTVNGVTPCVSFCHCGTSEPERLTIEPIYHMPGLKTPAFAVQDADPIGAGDCFCGADVARRRLGLPVALCLTYACAAGA